MEKINTIKEIQEISFEILKYIDKVCRENNLKYSLVGGTLLGAIRHKGFIPWDDDIDIMMPRPDYEKLIDIIENSSNNRFKALHFSKKYPKYFYSFVKIVDTNTKLIEKDYKNNENMGVFADIFPADGIVLEKSKKMIRKAYVYKFLSVLSSSKGYLRNKKEYLKNTCKFFLSIIAKTFGYKFWLRKLEKVTSKYKYEDCEYSMSYSGAYLEKEIFKKSMFDELIDVDFEGYKMLAFKDYDEYLTRIYGDYMTPPPESHRNPHHELKAYKK